MEKSNSKRKLLHIIPYDDSVPHHSGGYLRCHHLCIELTNYFNVTLLTLQTKAKLEKELTDNVKIITPSHTENSTNRFIRALKYRWLKKTFRGSTQAVFLKLYPVIKTLSKSEKFDVVLMEHLEGIELGSVVKTFFPNAIRIADLHNVDHLLYKSLYDINIKNHRRIYKYLAFQEKNIYTNADIIAACSVKDANALKSLNKNRIPVIIVPNGTTIKNGNYSKPYKNFNLIFCGSLDYLPNKEGLLWFYHEVWAVLKVKFPTLSICIIGSNGNDEAYNLLKMDKQIDFIGEVEDVTPYYQKSHLAIVPLLKGSGTRLKIVEAMSYGVPVLSTSIGAEGINYKVDKNILIANAPEEFIKAVSKVIQDQSKLDDLAKQGLKLINKKYSWKIIVHNFTNLIIDNLKLL